MNDLDNDIITEEVTERSSKNGPYFSWPKPLIDAGDLKNLYSSKTLGMHTPKSSPDLRPSKVCIWFCILAETLGFACGLSNHTGDDITSERDRDKIDFIP